MTGARAQRWSPLRRLGAAVAAALLILGSLAAGATSAAIVPLAAGVMVLAVLILAAADIVLLALGDRVGSAARVGVALVQAGYCGGAAYGLRAWWKVDPPWPLGAGVAAAAVLAFWPQIRRVLIRLGP